MHKLSLGDIEPKQFLLTSTGIQGEIPVEKHHNRALFNRRGGEIVINL